MASTYSTAILCGGSSRRMGEDKATLNWKGTALAAYKWDQFTKDADTDVFFSVRDHEQGEKIRELVKVAVSEKRSGTETSEPVISTVPDLLPGRGPLCGILSSLRYCREDILYVTAVDMPFSDRTMAQELAEILEEAGTDTDAVIPVSEDGREHPLCAVYRKSYIPLLEEQLAAGDLKVRDALAKLRVQYVKSDPLTDGERKLTNMNDRGEYRKSMQSSVPVYSLIAWSDTGKTTYLQQLIPALKRRGVRVAVIKHDGHEFDIDHEGTDSAKFTQAGADVSGIFSDSHAALMLNFSVSAEDLVALTAMSGTVDLIITEGCKKGKWPKILLYRESSTKPMAAEPDRCAAVISDVRVDTSAPVFRLGDVDAMADFLKEKC